MVEVCCLASWQANPCNFHCCQALPVYRLAPASLVATSRMLAYAGMVGDVNLYLNNADEPNTGEIEVIS